MDSIKKYVAEAIGTFTLTLFGCGSAAIAGATLGTLGIAFAFGLSIVAMAFAIGNVSGCHINPAVTFGLYADKRISLKDLFGYWIGQFAGGIVAAFVLTILGVTANEKASSFAGIVIGLTLTFVHIMGIPLTGTSVNPARSFGPALAMTVQGNTLALEQVWVFIFAPLVGAGIAAAIFALFKGYYSTQE